MTRGAVKYRSIIAGLEAKLVTMTKMAQTAEWKRKQYAEELEELKAELARGEELAWRYRPTHDDPLGQRDKGTESEKEYFTKHLQCTPDDPFGQRWMKGD